MSFTCDECAQNFSTKQRLQSHVLKKACKVKNFHCKYCDKSYTTETSMYRHVRNQCHVKKEEDKEKKAIYDKLIKIEKDNEKFKKQILEQDISRKQLQKDNKQLKHELDAMKKLIKKDPQCAIINAENVNNGPIHNGLIHNGDNYNIILVGYGREDISKIDKNELLKAIQSGYDSTLKLTEIMHFNPKHPEYHNVYIPNMKDKYAMMFDGTDWNLTMKDELINKIYDDKKNYIEENIDEFVASLSVSRKKALDRWLDTDDNNERISKVKNEIKLLLYNRRNLIIEKQSTIKKPNKKVI